MLREDLNILAVLYQVGSSIYSKIEIRQGEKNMTYYVKCIDCVRIITYRTEKQWSIGPFETEEEAVAFIMKAAKKEKTVLGHPEWLTHKFIFWREFTGELTPIIPIYQARQYGIKWGEKDVRSTKTGRTYRVEDWQSSYTVIDPDKFYQDIDNLKPVENLNGL